MPIRKTIRSVWAARTPSKAGEGIRTLDVQLGRLSTHHAEGLNTGQNVAPPIAPSSSASSQVPIGGADPELALIVSAWTTLAPAVRAGIVAMVKAGGAL